MIAAASLKQRLDVYPCVWHRMLAALSMRPMMGWIVLISWPEILCPQCYRCGFIEATGRVATKPCTLVCPQRYCCGFIEACRYCQRSDPTWKCPHRHHCCLIEGMPLMLSTRTWTPVPAASSLRLH